MARKIVDIGVAGNDGTGDSIREAFRKTNDNFQELYAVFGQGGFLKFTDLSDTPDSLTGEGGKVPVVDSIGTQMQFKDIVSPLGTVSITQTDTEIRIDTLSSRVFDDPLPRLKYGLNASNQLIGGLRDVTNETDFTTAVNDFNTQHATTYGLNDFAISKGYADARYINSSGDIMSGPLSVPAGAAGSQVPRASEVVLKAGGVMDGQLYLSDHPGELSGAGTPNGIDDLQAATKYYVDNQSFVSQINLFVSTSGDDTQARTPRGKEGRSWKFAYRSVNRACQKAEEIMNAAPLETGPYRQLIAYGNGSAFSEVTNITVGASGTTRVYFSNNGGSRTDQGQLPQPDIVSGKLVVGRTSGAKGIIYQYYGSDGSTNSDYFDLQDVDGEFILGENLEFDHPVKRLQITVFVESGIYEEDYPIRIPQNVAVVGEELRRVIIRPADRPSRSPWANLWFRRDKTFDGLVIGETEFGYHYLSDPSDRASEPKNNRDIDVFLCNDAVIVRQISCQGHGGFMMVLDPEGQVLSKSPYVQQSGSFAQSINKQAFRGGQYVDGFAGNIPLKIDSKLSNTELLVTGSERPPTTPCSFVIDGRTFKLDAYTDDGTGFGGARELIRKNKEFIKAEVIGYINSALSPDFSYNKDVCSRDIGLVVDALGYDLAIGTNFNSVKAGQAYYRGTQYDILPSQKTQTLQALEFIKSRAAEIVATNSIAVSRVNGGIDEIVDIINNGVGASDAVNIPNPPTVSSGIANAKALLLSNLNFLKAEVTSFISTTYPTHLYDSEKCERDTQYLIYAAAYDLIYGGNSQTVDAGQQYYDGNGSLLIPGETLQTTTAFSYLKTIMQNVVQSVAVPFPKQTAIPQVFDNSNPGSSSAATTLAELIDIVNTIILGGRAASPAIVYPNLTSIGISSTLTDARNLLINEKASIQADTITYIDQTYDYNQNTCARDTGYIVDAIAHDVFYGGNLKTVQAGLAYFNASASSKIVIDRQLSNTIAAINYIETLLLKVINNLSPTTRYQQEVTQYVNDNITNGNLASTKIGQLFDELIGIIDNPPAARDARSLLVANKEWITAEVINYIRATYVNFTYDSAKCQRDVGYIVDALGYDLMFGSNYQSVIAGRSYYRANAATAVGAQKVATLDAFEYLKTLVISIVTGNASAVSSVTANMNAIINIIDNGLTAVPAFVTPTPTGYDSGYQFARDLISNNREFIKAEVSQYLINNYNAVWTTLGAAGQERCRRDVGYLIDALYYDLTYGGNLQTLIAGNAYYVGTTLQVDSSEKAATLAAYAYMKTLIEQISLDIDVTELQSSVIQSRGTAGSANASSAAGGLIEVIRTIINSGPASAPAAVAPSTAWVNAGLISAKNALQSAKASLQSQVTSYIDNNYSSGFTYNEDICARDVGFIVSNVSADLLYGGTYNTIRAANRYHLASVSARTVINDQLTETLDALSYAKTLAIAALTQTAPHFNYQSINGVVNPVTQYTNNELDGSAFTDEVNGLMNLLNAIIEDPTVDITSVLPAAKPIVYPTYRLILSNTTPFTNDLSYTINNFVSKSLSSVGDGSYDVVVSIPVRSVAPLNKTRYRISGNSNVNYNGESIECVSSTTSTMTLRYPSDPGTWGTGTTIITYAEEIMTLAAGNTSMCCNDFTQINDLGYGLVATNIGLIEAVSVFTYYNWTAYFANNGGQIRSVSGSNAHGEYGLVSAGSDPLEVPDTVFLADDMIQVARVYKTGAFVTDNAADDVSIYVYNYSYAPYNVSEVEVNHGAGLITGVSGLVGGSNYNPTSGTVTYANVPLTGGTGTGATADITVTNGAVVNVSIRSPGIRYSVGDTLSANRANIGGGTTGSGFVVNVSTTEGNGIARYEVAGVTDVSSSAPVTVTGTPTKTGPTGGYYYVTYNFTAPGYTPKVDVPYTVIGSTTAGFNGTYTATSSTTTSVTLRYNTNPGTWAGGTTTLYGEGNIIRLNLNTGGNNETATTGLAVDLEHNQKVIIRGNQNFRYTELDDTNPTRPSTALTFVNDPNNAADNAQVYRVLAYGIKDPLNNDLAEGQAILSFDTTYDYIKLLPLDDYTGLADPENPGKTLGKTIGDLAIAVDRVNEETINLRLNSQDMIMAWDGKIHRITSYTDMGLSAGYAIVRFVDVPGKDINSPTVTGLNSSVDPASNLNIAEPPTLRVGLAATEKAEVVVRISTCRVTGHDFLEIGTGSYNQTNFPNKIYGAPKTPDQGKEVQERTRGRCFYVTTDQNGIFRVGRFFEVDQGTGRVTFAASIALSNLDGLGFKRGVTVSEFSNDDRFTDGANDALPTESAVQSYIDRRMGMDRNNILLNPAQLIGPGYLDRAGLLAATANIDLGSNKLINVAGPTSLSDAANKEYVDSREMSNEYVDTTSNYSRTTNDLLVFDGSLGTDGKWVNATTTASGDISSTLTDKTVALDIKRHVIDNTHINKYAAIPQVSLTLNQASATTSNGVGISSVATSTTYNPTSITKSGSSPAVIVRFNVGVWANANSVKVNDYCTVRGSSNSNINGSYIINSASNTSGWIELIYPNDPGLLGTGTVLVPWTTVVTLAGAHSFASTDTVNITGVTVTGGPAINGNRLVNYVSGNQLFISLDTSTTTGINVTSGKAFKYGLSAFNNTEFTLTNGFVDLQSSSNKTTGVKLEKMQYISNNYVLGNLTGADTYPREITTGQIVTAGDGIKNASFTSTLNGDVTVVGVMTLSSTTPNTYSVTGITKTGESNKIVRTDASGYINVKALQVDDKTVIDTASTTVNFFNPSGGTFLSSTGATGAVVTTATGTLNVNAISSASTTTFSPANANVTISPTGSGTVTIAPASVGSINNMTIGATTRGTGAFTTLAANDNVSFTKNTASTSATSGALVVTGGVGVGGAIFTDGLLTINRQAAINTTTPGFTQYGLHFQGQTTADYATGITFNGGSGTTNAQAGIYVQGSGSYGTKMYFGTTDNYSQGSKTRLTIQHNGQVTVLANISSTSTTTGTLVVTGGVGVSENLNVGGNAVIDGNLTVNGTTTTVNSTTVTVDDKNIELASVASPSDAIANGGGITLRGTTDKTINWLSSTGRWTSNQGFEATSIQNTPIGSSVRASGAFTTLTSNDATTFTANTSSTSTTTGTLVVTGGTGISENLYVGGSANIAGNTNISGTANITGNNNVTGAVNISGRIAAVCSNVNASGYNSAAIEVRELNNGGAQVDSWAVAPRIGFHWGGRVATQIALSSNGRIVILNNPGDAYGDFQCNFMYGTAQYSQYADLAEQYSSDADYEPGTVVVFGGTAEITVTNIFGDRRVAGVISTNPAHLMNSDAEGLPVALTGRVPCKVVGKVTKGDLLVTSAKPGYAAVNNDPKPGTIIGKALESKDSLGEGVIEVVVGRF